MRVLVLGLDGADYDLVRELLAQGKLPTISKLSRAGAFGLLRSTIPAMTPTAWSSFLTGLNPAGHGIFNFSSNPNRSTARVESARSRAGAPFWRTLGAAGIRSAFVGIPFTYPPEPMAGVLVTGYGGPERPAIVPERARERILEAHPDLVTAHHPMAERWWEDFDRYTARLVEHVEQIADVARLTFELEPDLGVLCVDFMSSDHAGHLGYHRLDPAHPAHDPDDTGDELVRVYEAVDRACGELIDAAGERFGEEPTALVLSDHGMKPIHWVFHVNRWLEERGHLRYRRRTLQGLRGKRLDYVRKVDQRLARTTRGWGRALDFLPLLPEPGADRAFADIDFGSTRAYSFASGGQVFLGEATGARRDPHYAARLQEELEAIRHPETGEPAFAVKRKEELYRGPFLDKAPELVLLPRDERLYVDSSRRTWTRAFERHERLDPDSFYGFSGHHALTGILAAAGPGIAPADVPEGSEITQLAATVLALHGLAADGLDGAPIAAILSDRSAQAERTAPAHDASAPAEQSVYSAEEEAEMIERLRDLGYE
jgi:predicted AlkP superfamily phosphohydrolase/phosphomutase